MLKTMYVKIDQTYEKKLGKLSKVVHKIGGNEKKILKSDPKL